MQVELQRNPRQYADIGTRVQQSKVQGLSGHDDVLGFEVPRRPRTCGTKPRDISPLDLWFLPSSKPEDDEFEVADILSRLAEEAAGIPSANGRPGSAAGSSGGALKRNGSHHPYSNGRLGASGGGQSWHPGAGPAKRRRSHDLLAGEDDYVDADDGDAGQSFDDIHSSPSEPSPRDEGPVSGRSAGFRRGRGGSHPSSRFPIGPGGLAQNGRTYHADGRPLSARGGRSSRGGAGGGIAASPSDDQQYDTKPGVVGLGSSAAIVAGAVARGAPNWAAHGQTSIAAARAASRGVPATAAPVALGDSTKAATGRPLATNGGRCAGAVGDHGAQVDVSVSVRRYAVLKGETSGEDQLAEPAGEAAFGGHGLRQGAADTRSERPGDTLGAGAGPGTAGTAVGASTVNGMVSAKLEPGPGSGPVSPSGDGGAGACGLRTSGDRPLESGGPEHVQTQPGSTSGGGTSGKALSQLPSVLPPAPHHLAELFAAGPLGPWGPLAGLLQSSGGGHPWPAAAAAAELVAKGITDAATKTAPVGPATGSALQNPQAAAAAVAAALAAASSGAGGGGPFVPPSAHAHHLQQLQLLAQHHQQQQQQQQAALKAAAAAAAGVPGSLAAAAAAAGLPPGGLEYLRALHANNAAAAAALTGHPVVLQAAAAGGHAAGGGGTAATPASNSPAAAPSGGMGSGPAALPAPPQTTSVPFKRCAQHVYIAHFIAQQQQLQHKQQQALQPLSTSGGNGATTTASHNTQPGPSGACSGSPTARRTTTTAQDTSTGDGGEASGGAGGACAQSPCRTSNGGACFSHKHKRHQQQQQQQGSAPPPVGSVSGGAGCVPGGASGWPGQSGPAAKGAESDLAPSTSGALPAALLRSLAGSGSPFPPPPLQQQQQALAASAAAAAAAAAATGAGSGPMLPQPSFQLPPTAMAAAMMAAMAAPAQHQQVLAAAAAAAAAGGPNGALLLPRGGPAAAPGPSAAGVPSPLAVGPPPFPAHFAQLLMAGPQGAAAAAAAAAVAAAAGAPGAPGGAYGLPAFVAGLGNPFGAAGAVPSPSSAAAGGPAGAAAFNAAAAAAVAAGVLPPGAQPSAGPPALAGAGSPLPPFFGAGLPPHFALAPGAGLPAPSGPVVLPQHLAQNTAAVHHLAAAAWQQQQQQAGQ